VWAVHHVGVGDSAECVCFPRFLHWSCVNYRGRRLHEFFYLLRYFFLFVKFLVQAFAVIISYLFFQIVLDWSISAEEAGIKIVKEALADSDERVEEGSVGTSEWDNLLDKHEVCKKKVADNQHRIVDLDKQLQEV